jgi:hypothetical protein
VKKEVRRDDLVRYLEAAVVEDLREDPLGQRLLVA